jgi:UDP-hydrolysing UDP-N-acetyl-D-glucosamine 2-epimerase
MVVPALERRTIAVLTTGRQDWGILRSVCVAIREHPSLVLRLIAGGMHLSPSHGRTIEEIRADGFEPSVELSWVQHDDRTSHGAAGRQAATALEALAADLGAEPPDALLLVGDRFETAAAAIAATIERVPVVHLHGGEATLGAFDDSLRHAITKLAHLHLVSREEHARRVIALGEDPASVHVVGAPGLDNAYRADLPDRAALATELGLPLDPPVVLVTVHPTTLEADPAEAARAVAGAMELVPATYVVTMPNVDPGATEVAQVLAAAAAGPGRVAVAALGTRRYWGLLRLADAMLGNSSSGLIETPVVRLPVVNVGDRQAGRHHDANVIDAPAQAEAVADALQRALTPGYRATMPPPEPPVPDGRAGERVAHIIAAWKPAHPPRKPPVRVTP